MRPLIKSIAIICVITLVGFSASRVQASSEGDTPLPNKTWHFDGALGSFDKAALQRGFKIYKQVCSTCHSMKQMYYRDLTGLGYTGDEVKAIASEFTVMDGPNDEGEMFERAGLPSDHFVSPFANTKAAAYANNGAVPPDLSLITKARAGGPTYVYSVLTGYEETPHDMEGKILAGQHYNKYMKGHIIAMAAPLSDGIIAYEDGSPETLEQYAEDVSTFLHWASDPHMQQRKRLGIKVFLYLLAFAGVMYATKRKVWFDKH